MCSVAAEEYCVLICCLIIAIYCLIILRSFLYTIKTNNLFFILSISGLAFQFGFQSLIHLASNTDIIPTKGMTLPFMSYGGSDMFASAITAGIVLAFKRKKHALET